MVYDCFPFFNELDLLEIRLNILSPVVDKFVLIEADRTFSNEKKIFFFEKNISRYKTFLEKIIHIKITEYDFEYKSAWDMEFYQRNKIHDGIQQCRNEDVIIISDVDEIPNTNEILKYKNMEYGPGLFCFRQKFFYYFLNYQNIIEKYFCMAKILTFTEYKSRNCTPQEIRDVKKTGIIKDGGWHFSFLGGYEMILYKVKSFAHQEYNNDTFLNNKIITKINKGYDIFNRKNYRFIPVKITNKSFPQYIVNNQKKYIHLVYKQINYFHNLFVYFTVGFYCFFRFLKSRLKCFYKYH
ncbi:MAG: hypothetical protein FWC03_00555 [Treponema sp.]|nr:hypothetical protein [Treponema sp.]